MFKPFLIISYIFIFFLLPFYLFAEEDNLISPYPGGSPFPPGEEPDLTHVVKVFWTTEGGVDTTRISVVAEGERPTRAECIRFVKDKTESCYLISPMIAPDCNYKYTFCNTLIDYEEGHEKLIKVNGQGTLTIEVHGFSKGDYNKPPVVKAEYYKENGLVGETSITAVPVSN